MPETDEQKAAREAAEAEAAAAAEAEAKAKAEAEAEAAAAREAELAAMSPEERAAKEAEEAAATAAAAAGKKGDGATEEETVVQIGDEPPPQHEKAPSWVTDLRKKNRELEKEVRTLKASQSGHQPVQLGPKPKLEDYDFDAEKFERALDGWHEKKRAADEQALKLEQQQQRDQQAWQGKLDAYGNAKGALKVQDFDDAESLVTETLSERQQAIIIKGAKNPALLIYALGKNPGKAKELAAITDLVEFAFAVASLEAQLKITTKKAAPPSPERRVDGTGPKSGTTDNQLDTLRKEAERTGDYSKVHAYKKQKKAA